MITITIKFCACLRLKLLFLLCIVLSQFSETSSCTCLGHQMRYTCTVFGGSFTLWNGSAFHCPFQGNEVLIHHSTSTGKNISESDSKTCNDGAIIGSTVANEASSNAFTSGLVIRTVSADMEGETVECRLLTAGGAEVLIGRSVIMKTTGLPLIFVPL